MDSSRFLSKALSSLRLLTIFNRTRLTHRTALNRLSWTIKQVFKRQVIIVFSSRALTRFKLLRQGGSAVFHSLKIPFKCKTNKVKRNLLAIRSSRWLLSRRTNFSNPTKAPRQHLSEIHFRRKVNKFLRVMLQLLILVSTWEPAKSSNQAQASHKTISSARLIGS